MVDKYPPLPQLGDVDLRLLRVFLAVVRNRGFSAAQSELNINQPTISVQMAQLEGRLRMKLCYRGRGGFKLTAEGEQVYEAAQRVFKSLEQFRSDVSSIRGQLSGDLYIGVVDAVATNSNLKLHETIQRLNEAAEAVELHIEVRSPQALLRGLLEERIHIAIAPFADVPSSIRLDKLHMEKQVLYCSREHPFFDMDDSDITFDLLAETPYASRDYLQNWSPPESPHFMTRAVTGDMEAMIMFILSGRFIGYLPRHFAQQWVSDGEIRPILGDKLSYQSQFYLATRKDEKNLVVVECRSLFECEPADN